MSTASLNVCLTCLKSYKRPEHLRRHQSSHNAERPFQCESCNKTFQRSDVLKRHLTTCDPGTVSELRPKKRPAWSTLINPAESVPVSSADLGRYAPDLSAIDLDLLQPGHDGRPFGHMAGWITGGMSGFPYSDPSDAIWQEFINFPPGTQTPRSVEPENEDQSEDRSEDLNSLSFLDNFTSKTGLVASFDCGTIDQRRHIASEFAKSERGSDLIKSHKDPRPADAFSVFFAGAIQSGNAENEQYKTDADSRHRDPVWEKSQEIIDAIKEVILLRSAQSPISLVWSSSVHALCLQFFSPENLRRFLEYYWAIWHPNVNFMHKPTFDPLSSRAALVASMSLIGASVSPNSIDAASAKRWFECVEEIVFNDCGFYDSSLTSSPGDPFKVDRSKGNLQALQAAYIVCLFQNWEGTDASKRRIRRHRYSNVVAAARDTCIHNARHPDYSQQSAYEFAWTDFVMREELIRVLLWTFLLDTAFVIFNNLPPRMVIREMKMDMACPEACFQATTSEDCFRELQTHFQPSRPEFRVAVEMLYRDPDNEDSSTILANLGPLNLFAMTSALHSHIFHHQNTFGCSTTLEPIRNALASWKQAWDVYEKQFSHSPRHAPIANQDVPHTATWKRVGFMRHASEYWLLANLIVHHLSTPAGDRIDMIPGATPPQIPSLGAGRGSMKPLLDKVDETSMQQINSLISDFQKIGIR